MVGQRQKKRKRKNGASETGGVPVTDESTRPKKHKSQETSTGEMEAFDFDAEPNILDNPAPVAAPAKKGRGKGTNSVPPPYHRLMY